MKRVLVACEFSGVIRDAFLRHGHDAWSCDLEETEIETDRHYVRDVMELEDLCWDLVIAHPPCTYLCNSGVRWLVANGPEVPERWERMREAAAFFRSFQEWKVPQIAIENPVMHSYAQERIEKWPVCTTQPWQFGHLKKKKTCWWLKGLPPLVPETDLLEETEQLPERLQQRGYFDSSKERAKVRSRTLPGVADAIARQWGAA